ncbi:Uncharacterised protein [Mycobacteroides abscessus subsp. abscessus]|nr:Uncharacterised protein [Mycobacteroides abscessus subsp. abscessus]
MGTVDTFFGSAGLSIITTPIPSAAAASNLAEVMVPPLFLVTRTSISYWRISSVSSATV